MNEALILKDGRAVKKNCLEYNLINPKFDTDGFLSVFVNMKTEITFFYVSKQNLSIEDQKKLEFSGGYCNKREFIRYKKGDITIAELMWNSSNEGNWSTSGLNNNWFDKQFKEAEEGDIAQIESVAIEAPYNKYFEKRIYDIVIEKDLTGNIKNYDKNNDGKLDVIPTDLPLDADRLNSIDGGFYNNHIILNNDFYNITDENLKKYLAEIVTKTSFKIIRIVEDIFPLLEVNEMSGSIILVYINQLKLNWENSVIINGADAKEFLRYYNSLQSFYNSTYYRNFNIISSDEKLKLLANILPISVLKNVFGFNQITEILKSLFTKNTNGTLQLIKTNLEESEEEFAIKLINSVKIQIKTEVDGFMDALYSTEVKTNTSTPPYKHSLFSLLYGGINDFAKPVKATGEFFDMKLTENKKRLVTALLYIWQESKYNPNNNQDANGNINFVFFESIYTYSTNYKPPIIKFINESTDLGISKHLFGYNENPIISFPFESFGKGVYWITESASYELNAENAYHLFQPITIINYPSEMDASLALPNKDSEFGGMVPIFYIKYINDSNNEDELWDKVGFLLDFVSTFAGFGVITKLRYLRHLSKLGQIGAIFGAVQFSAGVINFILSHVDTCNDSSFCKKLKTLLTFIEISSLITDPIILFKTKKAAREVVEEGIESGWPSGMLDEIDGHTPKEKILELANQDIGDYVSNYVMICKKDLLEKIRLENNFNTLVDSPETLMLYYSNLQIEEILTFGAGKGLSKEDSMGILFQACRIRKDNYVASIDVLKNRMDILVQVRGRKYPFTFNTIEEFNDYADNIIGTTLDKFALKKAKVYYTGSSITNQQSIGGGDFDTDWAVEYTLEEVKELLKEMEKRWEEAVVLGLRKDGKIKAKDMIKLFEKKGKLHKRYIIYIETLPDGQKQLISLEEHLKSFPTSLKTDITPVIQNRNAGYPRIKYNFN